MPKLRCVSLASPSLHEQPETRPRFSRDSITRAL
jgi:hypothetical protein